MAEEFSVSVVTPVYNAAQFVSRAVEAALAQDEVAEVILVEDCSQDNSLEVCRELASKHSKVRLIQHPDKGNHGAGETRNLGIVSAKCGFIAFADADNFYLPGRFKKDKEILLANPDVDGVYNAQGIHYHSEEARENFHRAGLGDAEFLSVSGPVPPDEFWQVMLGCHPTARILAGLGIDAITLRAKAVKKTGLFDPSLRLHQDVHFFVRMAVACRMASGVIDKPVAVRGVHGRMRSTDPVRMARFRCECWTCLQKWFQLQVRDSRIRLAFEEHFFHRSLDWRPIWKSRCAFVFLVLSHPGLLTRSYGFFDLHLLQLFGRNWATLHFVSAKNRVLRRLR